MRSLQDTNVICLPFYLSCYGTIILKLSGSRGIRTPTPLFTITSGFQDRCLTNQAYASLYGNLFNYFSKVYPETTLWIFRCDLTSYLYFKQIQYKYMWVSQNELYTSYCCLLTCSSTFTPLPHKSPSYLNSRLRTIQNSPLAILPTYLFSPPTRTRIGKPIMGITV